MKDKHKNLPPAGHQAPPPPEKHHKHEKRRRRGPSFGFIFLLLLVLAVAALVLLWKLGYIHFGKDSGDGGDTNGVSSVVTSTGTSDTSTEEESTVIEIKVDTETIYFDGAQLASAEELKAKITEIGDKKTYNFVHDTAIKATYDEVKAVLTELEKALDIKVNYNDE